MISSTDIGRYIDEFTQKKETDIEEVQDWIMKELHLDMDLVKKGCNAIRHYDPTQLKEAYKLIQEVRQLLQTKSTTTYASSENDKYVEFRLVHQLCNGGHGSIRRFKSGIETFFELLDENDVPLCLRSFKSLSRLLISLITFCNSDSISTLEALKVSGIDKSDWVGRVS